MTSETLLYYFNIFTVYFKEENPKGVFALIPLTSCLAHPYQNKGATE